VVTEGQSLLFSEVLPATFDHSDEAQRDRLKALNPRTAVLVPLSVAGRTVGAMSLAASDRYYRGEDLGLAEAVASRVAAALENARLYDVARRAIATRDEFLHLAAHELRTPLTALQLVAEGAARRAGSGGGADASGAAIVRQVRRLGALVEHMLDAARIQTGGIALTPESYDLRSVVLDRAGMAAGRAARQGSALSVHAEMPLRGRWDRARIGQVIDELLDNAIRFGSGRPVDVTLARDDGWAVLAVRDQGIGVPADRLASIFSPFERAAPREQFGGLGLGLYIAKAIVEAHGGSIAVESHLGMGTTFVVRLPIAGSAPAGKAGA
jgi:signal transduction histidine kinase